MTEYYIFIRDHASSGWRMDDTIWITSQDAIDALNYILEKLPPDGSAIVGYSVDGKPIVIPNLIGELR